MKCAGTILARWLAVLAITLSFCDPTRAYPLALCSPGKRVDCIVDGDTFWWKGEKIRIADIDAPEKDASCAFERRLARHATEGLVRLLQQPFKITRTGKDRFGRTLALVSVDGRDVGATLVDAGLARPWTGHKEHWCGPKRSF